MVNDLGYIAQVEFETLCKDAKLISVKIGNLIKSILSSFCGSSYVKKSL